MKCSSVVVYERTFFSVINLSFLKNDITPFIYVLASFEIHVKLCMKIKNLLKHILCISINIPWLLVFFQTHIDGFLVENFLTGCRELPLSSDIKTAISRLCLLFACNRAMRSSGEFLEVSRIVTVRLDPINLLLLLFQWYLGYVHAVPYIKIVFHHSL